MARRRSSKTGTIGYDLNSLTHEVRQILLDDVGKPFIAELAERVAEEANRLAPVIQPESVDIEGLPLRRGPNKHGGSDSGPIKGSIVAQESQKVPNSWLIISPFWGSHFVEYGTKPHKMFNKKKGGKMVFPGTNNHAGEKIGVSFVEHPGAKANPFMRPAADRADPIAKEILREAGLLKQGQ